MTVKVCYCLCKKLTQYTYVYIFVQQFIIYNKLSLGINHKNKIFKQNKLNYDYYKNKIQLYNRFIGLLNYLL